MQSIRWLASGDAIRFKLVNIVQSFVVGGVRTGTDRPAGASQQVAEGFDEGPSGTVTGCPLNASQLCELIEGGGTRTWELRFEGQPLIVSGGFAWWPKKNRNKVAFRAFLSGSSGPALYSATWDPTERFIAPKVERLDPLTPGTVTCVDPQTLAVSNSPKYIFGAIAPSPSGRFLTIARTELTPQTDDQDCVFVESSTLLVLRETGFSQGEMASGSKIGGIAWQPDPANLEVIVIQDADRSLDGLKVELRDFTDRESIVAGSPQRGIDGRYFFEVLPGTYVVRATSKMRRVWSGARQGVRGHSWRRRRRGRLDRVPGRRRGR
ncbi:MAG: hypothetical protein IPK00_24355 [Deltaproteobacteria bacterium]|nr:hypothetical protein [Deltaproteobacteria bacterium]